MALTRPTLAQLTTGIARVSDPITTLHAGFNSANVDIGFLMNRANGLVSNVALYWNEAGNTFVTAFTGNTGETNSNILVSSYANVTTGHHLPGANVTYSLGSTTQRWKDLWLSGTTIYLGGATISSADANTVTVTNQSGGSFSITGAAAGQATGTFGNVSATSGLASSSTTTGALVITGGAGISGNLNVGTSVYSPSVNINSSAGMYNILNITGTALSGYGSSQTWKFFTQNATPGGPGSWILFPDSSTQTTAYPGTFLSSTSALSITNFSSGNAQLTGGSITGGTGQFSTLTATNFSTANAVITGGSITNTNAQWNTETATNFSTANAVITGGSVNNVTVGATTPTTGRFTTLAASTWANIAAPIYLTNNTNVASLQITGTATKGGAGYHDFLSVTNQGGGTNPNKFFRLNNTGNFEVINSAYTSNLFTLTDDGNITIPGRITVNSVYTTNGLFWAGNNNIISTGGGGSAPAGVTGQVQYNNGGTLGASGLYYYSSNTSIVATGGISSTAETTGQLQVVGGLGVTGNVWCGQVYATNNGNGTNYRIGDDAWLGDINLSNTTRLMGAQDGTQAYLVFGNSNATNYIGRSGTSPLTVTGAFSITGNTAITSTLYGQGIYDNSSRVISSVTVTAGTGMSGGGTITGPSGTVTLTNTGVTGISSSGTGNLTVSASTGAVTVSLPATGPGAVSTGSGSAIPVITTDAYGRVASVSTAALTAVTNLSSSGAANITISAATGSVTASLTATGTAGTNGSSTAIPTITTDAYGRVTAVTTNAVVAPAGTLTGSTLASGVTASSLTSVGTIATGTWSASFGAVSGANLTSLTAGNLSGTIPSAVLGNSTLYVGTTAIALNRATASQTLTGISIDGSAASATNATNATKHIVTDSRAAATTPQTIDVGVVFDFKQNTTEGLSDGGTYFGEMTFRQYGSGTDWSGGASHQLGFTDNGNVWQRTGSTTTWGGWKKLLDSTNYAGYTTYVGTTAIGLARASASQTLTGVSIDGSAASATTAGTVTTAAQTNITSVGTLTGLTVSGAIVPNANASVNIGSTGAWFATVYGKSIQAQYADLAEQYTSDFDYPPGTVVVFGGSEEITVTTVDHDPSVAGVISTDPAYLMNAECKGLPVAFTGRVPCRVLGPVKKGTVLVTSSIAGVARSIDNSRFVPGCVIGKALGSINTETIETIEVVVGRF